jgi:2-oxo-3-hexenedioate decarboxylase
MSEPGNLNEDDIDRLAAVVDDAAQNAQPIAMLSIDNGEITLEEGYAIQRASMGLRRLRADDLIGMKMGLTSRAKMEQVGVHQPIYGHLTRQMRLVDGGSLARADHCHPRVEPEVAFLLGRDITEPLTPAEAMKAVDGVCCALEVIDSRYKDFKFTLPDVVADNASSSRFCLSSTVRRPEDVDVANLGMVMEVVGPAGSDRREVQIGSSAAIYDHPARSLAALTELITPAGRALKAGMVVMLGAATAAVALQPGDRVRVRVDEQGEAGFSVT